MPAPGFHFFGARTAFFAAAIFLALTLTLRGAEIPVTAVTAVTILENENTFTLANGLVTAQISRASGDLISLEYKNLPVLDPHSRPAGYWSHTPARSGQIIAGITINPQTNGGERGEVSVKGIANGAPLGRGPGGSVVADIEIRYALGRGDSGIYTYSIFTHPTNYPATSIGEARFCLKLNDDVFDWMTVDDNRNLKMISTYDWNHGTPLNMKEARRMNSGRYRGQVEHKYDYSANQFDVRAWGWSSSADHVGVWLVNPSVEYLSGGPTKFELSAHRDATFGDNPNAPAPPTLLNYWRGSHYGGSICNIAATDAWTKVIGPFLVYCNSGGTHDAMWQDALARAQTEAAAWPYDWVAGVDYPHRDQRATVTGKITLNDPPAPGLVLSNLLVGLTAPDYAPATIPRVRGAFGGGFNAGPRLVDWQTDAKNYEFWVRADADGSFALPNVRAGTYTLHAIADGVLGDFSYSNVTVTAGQNQDLGTLDWQPVRHGRQLWDIGIPNRSGAEFLDGNNYFHWGWYLTYAKLFPNDVNYVIGKSDFRKDWFFEQVPHNENPDNTTSSATGRGQGRSTTWTIRFDLPETPPGRATLRLAICGVGARSIVATVNRQSIGNITGLVYNATIDRDGIGGYWSEHDLAFDASLMKPGENVLALTIPSGGLMNGIIYDYLRLELDENAARK
jgi:rhamnogalacturonan endolyase